MEGCRGSLTSCRRCLPIIAACLNGGAGDGLTQRWNEAAFDTLPHVLRDPGACDTSVTLLGTRLNHPILVASLAWQRLIHPDAERATAAAATAQGACMVTKRAGHHPCPKRGRRAPCCDWFQLYWLGREGTLALAR